MSPLLGVQARGALVLALVAATAMAQKYMAPISFTYESYPAASSSFPPRALHYGAVDESGAYPVYYFYGGGVGPIGAGKQLNDMVCLATLQFFVTFCVCASCTLGVVASFWDRNQFVFFVSFAESCFDFIFGAHRQWVFDTKDNRVRPQASAGSPWNLAPRRLGTLAGVLAIIGQNLYLFGALISLAALSCATNVLRRLTCSLIRIPLCVLLVFRAARLFFRAGGSDDTTIFGDMWVFNSALHLFEKQVFSPDVPRPPERQQLNLITRSDAANITRMYIYGGVSQSSFLNGAVPCDM